MAEFSEKVLPGGKFTVADRNVASVMLQLDMLELDMLELDMVQLDSSHHSHIQRWATACSARPALARARAKG